MDSLSKLKPGKQIVLLLTADDQVAGAEDANSGNVQGNAMAYVDGRRQRANDLRRQSADGG